MRLASIGILFLSLLFFNLGCTDEDDPPPPPHPQPNAMLKGVSVSPLAFDSVGLVDFFQRADSAGEIVMWAGDWAELNDSAGSPAVIATLDSEYHYTPLIVAQFFEQSTGLLLRPLNDSVRQAYLNGAATYAEKYQPEYIGFGIEVNVLYEHSPADFDSFAAFFPVVCDTVKAHSPNTKVFTTFQLEKMNGLSGGLFGGINDTTNTEWLLLNRFPRSDFFALTTYPGLVYGNPSELPSDYYSRISAHTTKPIVFAEIGWHTAASPIGWESSEQEQADFVIKFFEQSESLNPVFAIWSFLYDPQTVEPFNSMGLRRRSDGGAKPAWNLWLNDGQ
jgi:hypothetical protein